MEGSAADVAALVTRAAAGDRDAFQGLVQRFGALVWHITRAHGLSPEDAADVSQTAWLRFIEQIDRIREPERAGAWLATTTRRECLALIRRRARVVPIDLVQLEHQGGANAVLSVDPVDGSRLEAGDRSAAIRVAFATLPQPCQALLRLLSSDPAPSYEEVAAALGMAIGSIGPTRQRCLQRLAGHSAVIRITETSRDSAASRSDQP